MPTSHSTCSAMLRPSRVTDIRAAATSVNPCTGARSATSHGTSVAADLPGCRSVPGAQNTGIRGRLPAGRPGPASLQCRPANNRFEGYRDSNSWSRREELRRQSVPSGQPDDLSGSIRGGAALPRHRSPPSVGQTSPIHARSLRSGVGWVIIHWFELGTLALLCLNLWFVSSVLNALRETNRWLAFLSSVQSEQAQGSSPPSVLS